MLTPRAAVARPYRSGACARLALVIAVLASACTGGAGAAGPDEAPADTGVTGPVVVQAAASLTDAFAAVADDFEARFPGTRVVLNLAGSQTLATQIVQGAPADVFASADHIQMGRVAAEGLLAGPPAPFAANRLTIAVSAGNPLGVRALEDLADPRLVLVLPAPEVPAGRLAARVLRAAGVAVTPVSLEADVRATLAKVALGEADAALVYASDVSAAGAAVHGVTIPADRNARTEYPIATLAGAPNPGAAAAFVAHVRSPAGLATMVRHGFTAP